MRSPLWVVFNVREIRIKGLGVPIPTGGLVIKELPTSSRRIGMRYRQTVGCVTARKDEHFSRSSLVRSCNEGHVRLLRQKGEFYVWVQ